MCSGKWGDRHAHREQHKAATVMRWAAAWRAVSRPVRNLYLPERKERAARASGGQPAAMGACCSLPAGPAHVCCSLRCAVHSAAARKEAERAATRQFRGVSQGVRFLHFANCGPRLFPGFNQRHPGDFKAAFRPLQRLQLAHGFSAD
jgi:hypothetical protein